VTSRPNTYAAAGVDITAGERAVELIRPVVASTRRPEVLGDLGGFVGLFTPDLSRYRRPTLATSTDGVGTKLAIARQLDRHDTVGIDLVAMVVDDLVVCGAEPLFMTDYIACGRLDPERVRLIVAGVAAGCRTAGAALLGGETAEHPGVMAPDEYDLAGAGVGIVDADDLLGPHRVRPGDRLVAMASTGLHANGFSLVRRLLDQSGQPLAAPVAGLGPQPLGELLLTPSRIYAADCLALLRSVEVHALAHITGGGLAANLERVLPATVRAAVDRQSWTPPPVFGFLQGLGEVPAEEMARTFNLGVGMVAVLPPAVEAAALALLADRGVPSWSLGEVREREA
jgi:phosphoribosylformylglycinamidine cyclo-ligase